jgi:hypothetical protein
MTPASPTTGDEGIDLSTVHRIRFVTAAELRAVDDDPALRAADVWRWSE